MPRPRALVALHTAYVLLWLGFHYWVSGSYVVLLWGSRFNVPGQFSPALTVGIACVWIISLLGVWTRQPFGVRLAIALYSVALVYHSQLAVFWLLRDRGPVLDLLFISLPDRGKATIVAILALAEGIALYLATKEAISTASLRRAAA